MKKADITIIGAAIIDVLAGPVDKNILENTSTPVQHTGMSFGGDALNEAVVLSRLGINAELISKVGNDEAGKQVLQFLKGNGVHAKIKVEDNLETGINIVLVDDEGERRFLTNPTGSLRKLSEEDVIGHLDDAADIVCFASMFVSPMLDIPAMERLFHRIKSKTNRILVADMTTAKNGEMLADIKCLLPYIDYIIPNETEAKRLTGESDVYRNAELFLENGASCVIIKLGARGCLVKTEEQEFIMPAYPKAKAVDTTGAGDSFASGFVWGLLKGMPLKESVRFGCAVASCTVESIGANSAVETISEPMKRYMEMCESERK